MMRKGSSRPHALLIAVFFFCLFGSGISLAQAKSQELTQVNAARAEAFNGSWVINESLSDNTDDAVEAAIKEAGGKVKRRFLRKRPEDFYRGGPA